MKATLDFPDELYLRVQARSAMEGRPIGAVAVQLFEEWLEAPTLPLRNVATAPTRFDNAPWISIARKYVKPGMSHGMNEMRAAIIKGWSEESAEKWKSSQTDV